MVLCNAANVSSLSISAWLPVEAIRGQTASLAPSKTSLQLRSVIAFGGYLTPVLDGAHFLGAHYRHDDLETEPRSEDTTSMLDRCVALLPELELQTAPTSAERVCFRTSTVDRLPYIGP